MAKNKGLHMVTFILLVIGGLNWLAFGIFGQEIGSWVGGMDSTVARVIYILVGLSAIIELVSHKSHCTQCMASKGGDSMAKPQSPAGPTM